MKVQETIRRETLRVAAGSLLLTALMLLIFLLTGHMGWDVLLGALVGLCAGILNFFLLGLSVQKATEDTYGAQPEDLGPEPAEEGEDPQTGEGRQAPLGKVGKKARRSMQMSYFARMLMVAAVAILGVVIPFLNAIATIVPLVFPTISLRIIHLLIKKED